MSIIKTDTITRQDHLLDLSQISDNSEREQHYFRIVYRDRDDREQEVTYSLPQLMNLFADLGEFGIRRFKNMVDDDRRIRRQRMEREARND